MADKIMRIAFLVAVAALIPTLALALADEEASNVWIRFDNHEPMYFLLGEGTPPTSDVPLTYAKFQISFRYQYSTSMATTSR